MRMRNIFVMNNCHTLLYESKFISNEISNIFNENYHDIDAKYLVRTLINNNNNNNNNFKISPFRRRSINLFSFFGYEFQMIISDYKK